MLQCISIVPPTCRKLPPRPVLIEDVAKNTSQHRTRLKNHDDNTLVAAVAEVPKEAEEEVVINANTWQNVGNSCAEEYYCWLCRQHVLFVSSNQSE